jgi:CheY-like chemotaxis protein
MKTFVRRLAGMEERRRAYHLAMLDCMMPEMDGEMLGRAIKADPLLRDTRLIMLSSAGMRGDFARLRDAGFAAYLTKPVKPSLLFDTLAAVCAPEPPPSILTPHRAIGAKVAHAAASPEPPRYRILLAEDNIVNQKVAGKLLEKRLSRAQWERIKGFDPNQLGEHERGLPPLPEEEQLIRWRQGNRAEELVRCPKRRHVNDERNACIGAAPRPVRSVVGASCAANFN